MLVAYDTETTGLWKNALPIDHDAQPKICSISAILIEETGPTTFELVESIDLIVKPEGWVIPDPVLKDGMTTDEAKAQGIKFVATDVHGITHDRAMAEGVPLLDAMKSFNDLVIRADGLLAHNESYDNLIVRHALKIIKRKIELPEKRICTMMMAKDYCRLPPNFPGGDFKWPKLSEAYLHVFGREMTNAHNSAADIAQAVELYQELKRRGVPDAAPTKEERRGMRLRDWNDLGWSRDRIEDIVAFKNQRDPRLSEWDLKFLDSIDKRMSEFGDSVYFSEKQVDTLRKIEDKLLPC